MYMDTNTVISLPPGVAMKGDAIFDSVVNHEYKLNETGIIIIRGLLKGASVGQVCQGMAEMYDSAFDVIVNDVYALLRVLNQKALIHIHTPGEASSRIRNYLRQPMLILVGLLNFLRFKPNYKAQRYPASLKGIILSLKPFTRFLFYMSLTIMIALLLAVMLSTEVVNLLETLLFAATPVFGAVLFVVSIIVHEYGHLWSLRRNGKGQQSYIIRRGFSVNVAHPRLPRRLGVLVSLSGPLLALLLGAAVTALIMLVRAPKLYFYLAASIGLSQLYTLTPWNKDGQILWGGQLR